MNKKEIKFKLLLAIVGVITGFITLFGGVAILTSELEKPVTTIKDVLPIFWILCVTIFSFIAGKCSEWIKNDFN